MQYSRNEAGRTRFIIVLILAYCIIGLRFFPLPLFPIVGKVDISIELILFFLMLTWATLTFLILKMPPTKHLLIVFIISALALLYTFYGIYVSNNDIFRALFEFRPFLLYLSALFPVIFIRHISEGKFILKWIILLTIIFLPFLLLQYLLIPYDYSFIPGRTVSGFMEKEFTRFQPKATPIILFVFFYSYWKIFTKPKLLNIVLFATLLFVQILPLTRNLWISMIIGVMIITIIERKEILNKLPIMLLFILLGVSALSMFILETSSGQRVLRRAGMISISAIQTNNSLSWRSYETGLSVEAISRAPFLGHGLGYKYHNSSKFPGSKYYNHNSYLFLWMKMGLPGLITMAIFLAAVLKICFNVYKTYQDDEIIGGSAIAMFAYIIGVIPALVVDPLLSSAMTVIIPVSVLYGIFIKLKQLKISNKTA